MNRESNQGVIKKWCRIEHLIFLLSLGLFIKIAIFVISSGQALSVYNLGIDSKTYLTLAKEVATTGRLPVSQPPGFVSVLALFIAYTPNPVFYYKIFQLILLIPTVLCTVAAAKIIIPDRIAQWSAVALLSTAAIPAYCATVQYEIPTMFLVSANVLFLLRYWRSKTTKENTQYLWAAAISAMTGMLFREVLFVFTLVLFLAVLLKSHGKKQALIVCLVCIVPIVSLSVWRSYQYSEMTLVSNKASINFQIGNNPNANGTFNLTSSPIVEPTGINFVINNPVKATDLAFRKMGYLWGFLKDGWNVPHESSLIIWRIFGTFISYEMALFLSRAVWPILALIGIYHAMVNRRMRIFALPLVLVMTGVTALHLAFFGSYRFIVPFLPILAIFVAITLCSWGTNLKNRLPIVCVAIVPFIMMYGIGAQSSSTWRIEPKSIEPSLTSVLDSSRNVLISTDIKRTRRVGFVPPEFIPRGHHKLVATYSYLSGAEKLGRVIMRTSTGKEICSVVMEKGIGELSSETDCLINKSEVVYLEVLAKSESSFELKRIDLLFAEQ